MRQYSCPDRNPYPDSPGGRGKELPTETHQLRELLLVLRVAVRLGVPALLPVLVLGAQQAVNLGRSCG